MNTQSRAQGFARPSQPRRIWLQVLTPLLCVGVLAAVPQRRVKEQKATFEQSLTTAKQAWESQKFGTVLSALKNATELTLAKRRETIFAAFPVAPAGWKMDKPREDPNANNPFASGLAASLGNVMERTYRATEGSASVKITLTADSPMVQMLSMVFQNPAMLDKNSEMIEYDQTKAILKKVGSGLQLQMLLGNKDLLELNARGIDEDRLFKIMDQAALNKLTTALDN